MIVATALRGVGAVSAEASGSAGEGVSGDSLVQPAQARSATRHPAARELFSKVFMVIPYIFG